MTKAEGLRLRERLFILVQHALPHHGLAALMHRIARSEWRPLKRLLIAVFARHAGVALSEAALPDKEAYPSFNAFFTRALRPDARLLCPEPTALISPADGALSQFGRIAQGRLYQAKGLTYSLAELLGGDTDLAAQLAEGSFVTIYLAPRDYHRVHMPITGTLRRMRLIPGRLFSVNSVSTRLIPRLFPRNERVVSVFETQYGPLAMILVGAFFVGSIETVWCGEITAARRAAVRIWDYDESESPITLARGAEMGRFNLGSTVILLLPAATLSLAPSLRPGAALRLGERLGELRRPRVG
jgi:phosphatidylserine decarboxylase